MATHSSVLVWRIPWTEEAGEVQSIGSQTRLKWLSSHAQCVIGQRILRPPGLHPLQLHPSCTLRGYYREETILALHSPSEAREVAQSCLTLCDPMDCSLQGSSVHGIFQARVLEWVAISFSRGSSQTRDRIQVSCIAGRCFTV